MVRRSLADDSYGRGPFARSIELGEIDSLPCAERDRAVAHRKSHGVANEHRLDVSRSVTFGVRVLRVAWPPLTTSTVRRPRASTFRVRTAASGAAPDGSTRSESDSRYSYDARSRSRSLTVTNSSTYRVASATLSASVLFATSLSATLCGWSSTIG